MAREKHDSCFMQRGGHLTAYGRLLQAGGSLFSSHFIDRLVLLFGVLRFRRSALTFLLVHPRSAGVRQQGLSTGELLFFGGEREENCQVLCEAVSFPRVRLNVLHSSLLAVSDLLGGT